MYKKNIILTALFLFNINNVFAYNKHDRNEFLEQKILVVPSGMRTSTPIISDETFARIAKKNNLSDKSFGEDDLKKLDTKFTTIVGKLKKQHVFDKIGETAKKYGVKPETVAACIIGEHVFNVNLADNFQNYFINVYSKWILKHDPAHDIYLKFIEEPEIAAIIKSSDINDYEKWNSIFELYTKKYRGRGQYPDTTFLMSFFNPLRAGLTYGLGQLSPIRILLTNDLAVKYGSMDKIDPKELNKLYQSTLDVDMNISYVAASVVAEIDNYKKYANFDISNNIGVIATLYNLGDEKRRAIKLGNINIERAKLNKEPEYPKENFYGWYMNKKENQIKSLFLKTL